MDGSARAPSCQTTQVLLEDAEGYFKGSTDERRMKARALVREFPTGSADPVAGNWSGLPGSSCGSDRVSP